MPRIVVRCRRLFIVHHDFYLQGRCCYEQKACILGIVRNGFNSIFVPDLYGRGYGHSAYPGWRDDVADYPSCIIPYTPICISLIICIALLPLVFKVCKAFALPALSLPGLALFLVTETRFEQIAVFTDVSAKMKIETWQLLSCVATPQGRSTVWDSLNIRYSPVFKIHFYAIAMLIVLAVTGVVYGFYKMAATRDFTRKKPLVVQLVSVVVFIGLCILACFTAFFRTGAINLSPRSAILMTAFFLVFGITAGVYAGTWLYGKRKGLSVIVPSVIAILVTVVMYIGEMVMMGGSLFQLGNGFIFNRLGAFPLSVFDVLTILLSGVATYLLLTGIRRAPATP